MIIDAHLHLLRPSEFPYPWMTGRYLRLAEHDGEPTLDPWLADRGVDGAVLIQAIAAPAETAMLLNVADHNRRINGVVGWTDLTDSAIADRIEHIQRAPGGQWLVGLRHQTMDETDPEWLAQAPVRHAMDVLAARSLTFDLLISDPEMRAAIQLVESTPDGRFVIDHSAHPSPGQATHAAWRTQMQHLAAHPGVACKLSGLVARSRAKGWPGQTLPELLIDLLSWFGPDRLLWGSDWPVASRDIGYADNLLLTQRAVARLDPNSIDAVFARNATRWYREKRR